jgi:hypothetical protein
MIQLFLWFLASFILAIAFTLLEILVLVVGINNLHFSLYYSIFGIAAFLCRYQALNEPNSLNEWDIWFKIGSLIVLLILIVGCIALLANIAILIARKI